MSDSAAPREVTSELGVTSPGSSWLMGEATDSGSRIHYPGHTNGFPVVSDFETIFRHLSVSHLDGSRQHLVRVAVGADAVAAPVVPVYPMGMPT